MIRFKKIILLISLIFSAQATFSQTFITEPEMICVNEQSSFFLPVSANVPNVHYVWNFGGGSTDTSHSANPTYMFATTGDKTVTLSVKNNSNVEVMNFSGVYSVGDCSAEKNCTNCLGAFSADQNKKYVVSAWVSQDNPETFTTFPAPALRISFTSGTYAGSYFDFVPSGNIIDGWQRISGEFTVPSAADTINFELMSTLPSTSCYFDDIRIHPFDGNMKSYVYDPQTMKLTAELDNNNYATFYEYDEEGKLIRVKKETERGIMTIKESRNNTYKP